MSTLDEYIDFSQRLYVTIKTKDGRVHGQGPYIGFFPSGVTSPIAFMKHISEKEKMTTIMIIEEMPKKET